jgi:hypothetical protein
MYDEAHDKNISPSLLHSVVVMFVVLFSFHRAGLEE